MKLLVVATVFVVFTAAAPSGELELLEAVDFDALENNEMEKEKIFSCLLAKTPCGDLQAFRDSAIKVMKNKCAGCSPKQQTKYDTVVKRFHDKHQDVYNEFMKILATETA